MAADEILGISGQMDVSDIQKSFDTLLGDLDKLGAKTDSLSARMSKALNEIAQSSDINSKSTQQAFKELNAIITEAQEKLTATPKKIQNVSLELSNATTTIETLKDKLSKATAGTAEWETINKMLENQGKTVERLKTQYTTLTDTFADAQTAANVLNMAMDGINAARSISNTATGVNAGLHVGVATAVGTESVAHGVNAEKIGTETQAVKDNTQAYQKAAEANQQRTETANAEAAALDKLTERVLQGKTSEEEYIKAKESAEARYRQLMSEQTDLLEKEKKAREAAYTFKIVDGNIINNNNDITARAADALLERANRLKNEANEIASSLQRLSEAYTSTAQKAETEQKRETESTNKTLDAIRAKEDELKKLNEQLEQMQAHHANGWGGDFISTMRKGDNPFTTIKDYFAEGDAIKEKQQQIAEVTAQLEKLRTATEETKTASTDMWSGMSKNDIATVIQEDINQLKTLKSEYSEIAQVYGKDSDKAKENKQKQEEITREIIQGKEKLREMGTSYEDVAKAAKKAAKSTGEIGDKAKESTGKIKGIIDKLKSFLTKGFSLDGILGMVFSPKGAALAGITAVAGGMKWLSQQAESLRVAMGPLKTYLDEGVLEDLRQQFVALEYESSHSAEEMAAAGTRWVKYFEGLRGSAGAISEVTKSSNDFATVLGTTSEKAADYQLRIAGAYHQTALEAESNSTIIINASKQSTAKYEEIAQALASYANRAQNAGASLKEFAAATAYGSSTFGSASEAASTYVMMLTRLASQSKNEYNPAVVGVTKALENLSKSNELNNTLTTLLGKRQASLAKVFVQNAAAIAKMKDGLDDEASAAAAVAAAESKVENTEKRLQNAKKALAHEVNTNLTPAYASFVEYCTYFVKTIGQVTNAIKKGIKPVVDYIASSIASLDKKLGNSRFSALLGKGLKGISYLASPLVAMTTENMINDKKRTSRQEHLKQIYNEELKKAGEQSPGKAYLKAAKRIANNGLMSKEDKKYLQSLMSDTRTLANSKTTGQALAIGEQNGVKGKSGENKLKQLQEQQRKFREEEAEREAKELANSEKIKWDLYVAEQENGIAKMTDVNEKENAQRKLDFEKKKHEIEEERKTLLQQNIQTAKALYEKNPDNKGKEGFYASGLDKNVKLTTEQVQLIKTKLDTLNAEYENESKKRLQEELQSLYDYLKEYGTVQEQRYAIAKEYDEKIQKAANDNQKKLLQKQKESALSQVDARNLALNIDWGATFQGVGNVLGDIAKEVLSKVEEYMKTTEFKGLDASDKKTYVELRQNLRNETSGGTSPFNLSAWKNIAQQVTTYQNSVKKLKEASEAHTQALKNLENAEQEMNKATTEKARQIAQVKVIVGKKAVEMTGETQQNAQEEVNKAQSDLADSTNKAAEGMQNFQTVLGNLTSGSLSGFANAVAALINSLTGGSKELSNALQELFGDIGGLIGAILQIMDALGDTPVQFIDNLLSKISKTIEAVISNIPQIAFNTLKGVGNIVGSVIKGLGNVFSGGALFGGNTKKMEAEIAKLSEANEALAKSIEGLKDAISNNDATSKQSREAYKNAVAAQKEYNENQKNAIKKRASEYSNSGHGFLGLGGRSSFNNYANRNKGLWQDAFNQTLKKQGFNTSVNYASDVWELSPEMLKALRDYAPKAWAAFFDKGSKGEANPKSLVDDYISQAGSLDSLTDALNEKLTGYTWDGFRDSYASLLKDLESETTDFGDFINKTISNAIIESLITSPKVQERIKKIYKMIADATDENSEGGEDISKDEADAIRKENESLANDLLNKRKELEDIGLVQPTQSEQSATSSAIQAITADQASTLIGIGYAMQIALEQGNETRKVISTDVGYIRLTAETLSNNISEMRDIQYQGLHQLEAINKNTYNLFQIKDDMHELKQIAKKQW